MGEWITQNWIPADGAGLSRRAKAGGSYQAYVPDLLRSGLEFSSENILRAGKLERALLGLRHSDTAFGLEGIARFLLRSEAISSSKIEGHAPKPDKVALAELAQSEEVRGFSRNAELVANNIAILRTIQNELAESDRITPDDLTALQAQLLGVDSPHGIRTEQNWIGGSSWNPLEADFVPPPADLVPEFIQDLCTYLSGAEHGALIQAAIVHAQFETIHPFADGNGRVGRALIHAVLQRRGLTIGPTLPISMIFGTWSDQYVSGLTSYRSSNPDVWLEFFLNATEHATQQSARIASDISDLNQQWEQQFTNFRATAGFQRAPRKDSAELKTMMHLAEYPVLTASSAMKNFGLSATAAKRALDALSDAGILRKKVIGKSGTTGYFADEVLDLITVAERRLASTKFDTRLSPPRRATPQL